jgi:hypothetical protein
MYYSQYDEINSNKANHTAQFGSRKDTGTLLTASMVSSCLSIKNERKKYSIV